MAKLPSKEYGDTTIHTSSHNDDHRHDDKKSSFGVAVVCHASPNNCYVGNHQHHNFDDVSLASDRSDHDLSHFPIDGIIDSYVDGVSVTGSSSQDSHVSGLTMSVTSLDEDIEELSSPALVPQDFVPHLPFTRLKKVSISDFRPDLPSPTSPRSPFSTGSSCSPTSWSPFGRTPLLLPPAMMRSVSDTTHRHLKTGSGCQYLCPSANLQPGAMTRHGRSPSHSMAMPMLGTSNCPATTPKPSPQTPTPGRFNRSRSTSALTDVTNISLLSRASIISQSTCPCPKSMRSKAAVAEPAVAKTFSEAPAMSIRSGMSSSATMLSELRIQDGNKCLGSRSSSSSRSASRRSSTLSSRIDDDTAIHSPLTVASSRGSSEAEEILSPLSLASEPPTPSVQTVDGGFLSPATTKTQMKRSRSTTVGGILDPPHACPDRMSSDPYSPSPSRGRRPPSLRTAASQTMLKLGSMLGGGPNPPLKSPLSREMSQDSYYARQCEEENQSTSELSTPLTPEHLAYIKQVTVSYLAGADCAPQCKRLVMSLRRLSAPLPVLTNTSDNPSVLAATILSNHKTIPTANANPRVMMRLLDQGDSRIDVLYRDGRKIAIDPNEHTYSELLGRIGTHAYFLAQKSMIYPVPLGTR